ELITAYMHEIRRYDKEAVVLDYYTNEEITIPLDPEIAPNDNAQRYYRRYNKLKNRGTTARDQLEKAYSDRDFFLNLLHQVDALTASNEVEESSEEPVDEGILKFKSCDKKKKTNTVRLHQFSTSNGLTVLVGKNNKPSDHWTAKKAQNDHLWFHAKDI